MVSLTTLNSFAKEGGTITTKRLMGPDFGLLCGIQVHKFKHKASSKINLPPTSHCQEEKGNSSNCRVDTWTRSYEVKHTIEAHAWKHTTERHTP
jgi:hypothetical protein